MSRIKLFEKFNASSILELRDDIKSILYELDDMDLNVRFRTFTKVGTDEDANEIDGTDVDYFLIMVKPKNPNLSDNEVTKKMKRFLVLLKIHLDYIRPSKIKLGNGKNRFDYITIKV